MSGIVKPLAWEADQVGGGLKAGEYRVRAGVWTHGYYWTKGDNEARTGFEDEEAAHSAATADFEQYVLSCLDPSYASSQAEIERLTAALGALLADAPDTLGCGHRCMAEISDDAENSYAISLRFARAALSGSKE